jgi:transposase
MADKPWIVSDELWELVEPLLPHQERRFRYPGRKRLSDRSCLCGILYVLHTGIPWLGLPQELGFGSGMTCWRRLEEWHQAGAWDALHQVLLTKLRGAGKIDLSRAIVDSSHVQAKKGAPKRARARSTAAETAPNTTSSPTRPASRSRPSSPRPAPTTSRNSLRS